MRRILISLAAGLAVALPIFQTHGQQPPPKLGPPKKGEVKPEAKGIDLKNAKLEDLLAQAVKGNLDIKVAEAKVHEADAELNRARLAVMQKVVKMYHDIAAGRAQLDEAESRVVRLNQAGAAVAQAELQAGFAQVQQAKANLAKLEADLPYLLGKQSDIRFGGIATSSLDGKLVLMGKMIFDAGTGKQLLAWDVAEVRVWDVADQPKGTFADNLRKALDTPIKIDFPNNTPQEILDYFQVTIKGINIHVPVDLPDNKIMKLNEPVPLGAALQMFEDTFGLRFLVRKYGLVVSRPGLIPPGALTLHEFWKNPPKKSPSGETRP